jgi:hypothetical protein
MNYNDYNAFLSTAPILYGQIIVNDKCKIGQFRPEWGYLTNSLIYQYYTPKGRKGKGGFSAKRAYCLYSSGSLSVNPENGNPANYL